MLIGTSQEERIQPHHALLPGNRVARNGRVGMADVRPSIHVIDGGGDVKLLAWFHLQAVSFGRIERDVPQAIALLGPMGERVLRVLCIDGDLAFPATVPIGRISAARPADTWYPYGAGAFGAELMF